MEFTNNKKIIKSQSLILNDNNAKKVNHMKSQSLVEDILLSQSKLSPTNTVIVSTPSRRMSLQSDYLDLYEGSISLEDIIMNKMEPKVQSAYINDKEYEFWSKKEVEFTGKPIDKKIPIVLITNCKNGEMGHYLAKHFLSLGCKVIALAPSLIAMSHLLDSPNLVKMILNFENEYYIKYVLKAIGDLYPRIDIICVLPTMDGIGALSTVEPITEYEFEASKVIYQLNLIGPLQLIQPIIRWMCRNQHHGLISFMGSILADVPSVWNGLFTSCMSSIHSLANTLRLELNPFNIDVLLLKTRDDKSMICFNNLEFEKNKSDNIYKNVQEYILFKSVISQQEIKEDINSYALISQRIIMNRFNGAHKAYSYLINPFKWLLSSILYILFCYIIPNYEVNFNYFFHKDNPGWPTNQFIYYISFINDIKLSRLHNILPNWLMEWYCWDLCGIGYVKLNSTFSVEDIDDFKEVKNYANFDSLPNSLYSNSNSC